MDKNKSCDSCKYEYSDASKEPCKTCAGTGVLWESAEKEQKQHEPINAHTHEQTNIGKHFSLCFELNTLYVQKNADYGDSFHKTYLEEGMAMPRIRLSDKLERFKKLTRSNEMHIKDESIRDTLIDLANYAIMTVMEMDGENNTQQDAQRGTGG